MIVLARMMPCDSVLIARHLHEDTAAQMRDERLVMREPGNRADSLWSKPKADAHRTSRKRILSKSPRQLNRADNTRTIVISLHGVTSMRLHKKFAYFRIQS